jgi:hypothetical protein
MNPLKIEVTEAMREAAEAAFCNSSVRFDRTTGDEPDLFTPALTAAFQHPEFLAQLEQWRPIESCPPNRTVLLLVPEFGGWAESAWKGRHCVFDGRDYKNEEWRLAAPFSQYNSQTGITQQVWVPDCPAPIGWLPLPEPPRANLGRVLGEG